MGGKNLNTRTHTHTQNWNEMAQKAKCEAGDNLKQQLESN